MCSLLNIKQSLSDAGLKARWIQHNNFYITCINTVKVSEENVAKHWLTKKILFLYLCYFSQNKENQKLPSISAQVCLLATKKLKLLSLSKKIIKICAIEREGLS